MKQAPALAIASATVLAIVAACSVDVDLAGKGCPCPDGLLCDEKTNTCVTSLPATVVESDAGPPPAACLEAECKCTKNEECRDPKRAYCGPAGTCVECLVVPNDTCTAGGYCNAQNQCVVGCKTPSELEVRAERQVRRRLHGHRPVRHRPGRRHLLRRILPLDDERPRQLR